MKFVGAILVLVGSFFVTLWTADYFWPPPCAEGIELQRPFKKLGSGLAYVAPVRRLDAYADTPEFPQRSQAYVCENDKPLEPAHSAHGEIEQKGGGRFSHYFGVGFIFSTSDNSDPNTNGRRYWVIPQR